MYKYIVLAVIVIIILILVSYQWYKMNTASGLNAQIMAGATKINLSAAQISATLNQYQLAGDKAVASCKNTPTSSEFTKTWVLKTLQIQGYRSQLGELTALADVLFQQRQTVEVMSKAAGLQRGFIVKELLGLEGSVRNIATRIEKLGLDIEKDLKPSSVPALCK